MKIFDIHSDTPFELFRNKLPLNNNKTNVSPDKLEEYDSKLFVSAFFSDSNKTDSECFREFLESSAYYDGLISENQDNAMLCKSPKDIFQCAENGKFGVIKAIEDIRIIEGDIDRLQLLYNMGVRHIVPIWGGESHIGGAWDTNVGLTDFGKKVIGKCRKLGMIVDVSHMSKKSFWDTAEQGDFPFVASHSNYDEICSHGRNLDKTQLLEIIKRGGLVGINLCIDHVNSRTPKHIGDFIGDVTDHIYYCLERGGEKAVCLGCDWDGTEMSSQIRNVSDIYKLYERLLKDGISESTADDIFFNNAYIFYINNLE